MASRRKNTAEGPTNTDLSVSSAEGHEEGVVVASTPAPSSPSAPPDAECTDPMAQKFAGFLVERVRMFKLPSNHVYLIRNPDGTVRVWSKRDGL